MISDKKLKRIENELGKDIMTALEAKSPEELRQTIANGAQAIKTVLDELEANPKYQELKESLKAISSASREVKAYQNAKIQYSLHLIEESGK